MFNLKLYVSAIFIAALFYSCKDKNTVAVLRLKNNSSVTITDVIEIRKAPYKALQALNSGMAGVYDDSGLIPFHVAAKQDDETSILVLTEMEPNSTKELTIARLEEPGQVKEFSKMTQAELWIKEGGRFVNGRYEGGHFVRTDSLRVPEGFTDHAYYIKYEGPGWESDKVGYRFYLDGRNAIDVFGKKAPAMALNEVGQDGYDSYHEPAEWGMDILKVGKALGVGTIAYWTGEQARRVDSTDSVVCRVIQDGTLRSAVLTNYYGWSTGTGKFNMDSYISIDAGSRMSKMTLRFNGKEPDNICTGINKDKNAELVDVSAEGDWACLASWGKQSLANDYAGIAIFYKKGDLIQLTEDQLNHVVVLRPRNKKIEYFFAAAWEQEPEGVKSIEEFKNYLDWQLTRLNKPVNISIR